MELPNAQKLKKLIDFCRKNGISELKHGEFEVKISPAAHFPEKPQKPEDKPEKPTDPGRPYTEEEVLFYSTSQIPMDEKEAN